MQAALAADRTTWTEIRDLIHGRILDFTYAPGDRMPRDEDLAAEFGCARSTVHRAMRALADQGLVERRRKGGTTVHAEPVTRATLDIPVVRREVENRGAAYGYQLIDAAREPPPPSVAASLGLRRTAEMLRVRALHLGDARPFMFEDRWICIDTVPEIVEVDLADESANAWLIRNRPYSRCDLRFYAKNASTEEAAVLDVPPGAALFVTERTTWIGDEPITFVRAIAAPGYSISTQI